MANRFLVVIVPDDSSEHPAVSLDTVKALASLAPLAESLVRLGTVASELQALAEDYQRLQVRPASTPEAPPVVHHEGPIFSAAEANALLDPPEGPDQKAAQ